MGIFRKWPVKVCFAMFLWVLIARTTVLACATCSAVEGLVLPKIDLRIEEHHLRSISIEWEFAASFTDSLRAFASGPLDDPAVQQELLDAMEIDMRPNGYLTHLTINGRHYPLTKIEDRAFRFRDTVTSFVYRIDLHEPIRDQLALTIGFADPNRFLSFFLSGHALTHNAPYEYGVEHNLLDFPETLELRLGPSVPRQQLFAETSDALPPVAPTLSTSDSSWQEWLRQALRTLTESIRLRLETVQAEGSVAAFVGLLLFSLLYGMLHALGPGHGKTLVASYFLTHERDHKRAALMALGIGAVHVLAALGLTLAILYIVQRILVSTVQQAGSLLTIISGVLVLLIALRLVVQKIQHRRAKNASAVSACGCSACHAHHKGAHTDWMLVLSAGIVPCPGTVTIFLFTFSMGMYLTGFLAALLMSIGMGVVLFASAALTISLRQKATPFATVAAVLEYGSIVVIFALGLALLLAG